MRRRRSINYLFSLPTILCAGTASNLLAAPAAGLPGAGKQDSLGLPLQIVLLLTLITLAPAVIVSLTPFLRITVVLHFLRQALGTQTTPSNQVLIGLALFLALLIMQPVLGEVYSKGWEPMSRGDIGAREAFEQGSRPLKMFLLKFVREKELRLFLEITRTPPPRQPADVDLKIVMPAYMLSELKAGFQIGAVLFLPFLIIDVVVASVTLSVGMVQLPPVMVSAPFKILLFVLVDGWNLVVGSLLKSFY
jgi:flagellar biosynthetic protein FliP